MTRSTLCLALFGAVLASAQLVHAEYLPSQGQTYALDPDARQSLREALGRKQASGELQRFWKAYRERVLHAALYPEALDLVSRYTRSSELHTLRYTFAADVRDAQGALLVPKGTVVQPLQLQPLRSGLVFIDGRDPRQVEYAVALGRQQSMKIVLTAGSPYALRLRYRHATWWAGSKTIPFYFDQRRMILDTLERLYGLHIQSVPVRLTQRGAQLAIDYGLEGGP